MSMFQLVYFNLPQLLLCISLLSFQIKYQSKAVSEKHLEKMPTNIININKKMILIIQITLLYV